MTNFEKIDDYIWYYVNDKNDCNFMDVDYVYDADVVWEAAGAIYGTRKSAVTLNFFTDWYYRDDEMPQGWNFSRETRSVYYDFIVELLGENWDYIDYGQEKHGVLFFNTRELANNPEKIDYDKAYHIEMPYYEKLIKKSREEKNGNTNGNTNA